jgi:hypothetical protein
MNKAKQKRRYRKAIKRRPRIIHQEQEKRTAAAWRRIFWKAGILENEQYIEAD